MWTKDVSLQHQLLFVADKKLLVAFFCPHLGEGEV